MTKITYIPGEIANAAIDENGNRKPITRTQHIFDDDLGKPQSQVNQERIEAENTLDGKIATERQRAEVVEGGLNTRLQTVEQLAEISIDGGEAQIATGSDFTNPDATKRAKIPTVGAIIDGLNDGVYDVSKRNPTAGPNSDGKFTLDYILDNADTLIPVGWRHGGMTISFVQSSDNKYVQYRLMADEWSANEADWDKIPSNIDVQTIETFLGDGEYTPILLGNFIVLNGVITSNSGQACKYFKIIKGQKFGFIFSPTETTIRYGFFSNIPKNGDTTENYGNILSGNIFTAPSNGYFAFSYNNTYLNSLSIIPYSRFDDIETEILTERARIETLSTEVKDNTAGLYRINDSVLPYVTIESVYLPNGKVTFQSAQNTYYQFFKKGTKITVTVTVSRAATFRWGIFADVPVLDAQASDYGQNDITAGSTYNFNYTTAQDGYLAVSIVTATLTSISFETEGILNDIADELETATGQIEESEEEITNLIEIVGKGKQAITMVPGFYTCGASMNIGDTFNPTGPTQGGTYNCAKIECQSGDKLTLNASAGSTAGIYCFTNSSNIVIDVYVVQATTATVENLVITAPVGAAHFYLNDNSGATSYVGEDDNITKLNDKIDEEVARLDSKNHFNGLSSVFSLASSASKTLDVLYVRKNSRVSLDVGAFNSLRFGLGYQAYMGYWIEINSTTVSVYQYVSSATLITSYEHGLDISSGIKASIVAAEETASIILVDAFGTVSKTDNINWWGGGAAFVTNLGNNTIEGNIAYFAGDIIKKIWIFGDSYLSYNQNARWLYYMLLWGFKSWLANHLPGIGSANSIINFDNLREMGVPQYVVWCLGMNDGSDTDASTPNSYWLSAVEEVIGYCESNSIVPILCTIPTVPSIFHEGKNNWVRNSGYRYIDFAKAVNAQPDGTWTTGLLESGSNPIHPTVAGAKVLASQVLIDFPEIMLD